MKRTVSTIFAILPLLAAGLLVFQVMVANELAGQSKDLSRINREIEYQEDLGELLSVKLASSSSLATVSARAYELGFAEPGRTQIITLTAEVPMAFGAANTLDVSPVR